MLFRCCLVDGGKEYEEYITGMVFVADVEGEKKTVLVPWDNHPDNANETGFMVLENGDILFEIFDIVDETKLLINHSWQPVSVDDIPVYKGYTEGNEEVVGHFYKIDTPTKDNFYKTVEFFVPEDWDGVKVNEEGYLVIQNYKRKETFHLWLKVGDNWVWDAW